MKSGNKSVILGVTGSIAAYKACDIISIFTKSGVPVKVILSADGSKFLTPLTLQTLSCNKVYTDMFELPSEWDVLHTSLAESASAVLIAPATADIIGKIANGICDSLLACVVFATKAPVFIAPAMNENMFANKIVQSNIEKLKKHGYKFIDPIRGHLACGKTGMGHLAAPEDIVREVRKAI